MLTNGCIDITSDEEEVETNGPTNGPVDAIGSTAFSETFLLRTLIELSKVPTDPSTWTSSLEQDLSGVWDMTLNKEVVQKLVEHNFLSIFFTVATETEPEIPRLLEQLVGIAANMSLQPATQVELSRDSDKLLLFVQMLECSDALVLVQVLRLLWFLLRVISEDSDFQRAEEKKRKEARQKQVATLQTRLFALGVSVIPVASSSVSKENRESAAQKIGEILLPQFVSGAAATQKIIDILNNSLNKLLSSAIRLVDLLCQLDVNDGDSFCVHCASAGLVTGLVAAGAQIVTDDEGDHVASDVETNRLLEVVQTLRCITDSEKTRPFVCGQGELVMAGLVRFCEVNWRPLMLDTIRIFEILLEENELISEPALAMVLSISRELQLHEESSSSAWDVVCHEEDDGDTPRRIRDAQVPYLRKLWELDAREPFLDDERKSEIAAILIQQNAMPD